MSALDVVNSAGRHLAAIGKVHRMADNYNQQASWALLHNDGTTRTFPSFAAAKNEARKVYPGCKFKRGIA